VKIALDYADPGRVRPGRVASSSHDGPGSPIDPYQQQTYKDFAVKQICGGDMKLILQKKITIEYLYTYTDSAGAQKLRISIPPGSCS
jgi:hypothetical protein